MIVIDGGTCIACGQCVRICHEDCLSLVEGALRIDLRVVGLIYRLLYKPRLVFGLLRALTPGAVETDKVKMEATLAEGLPERYPAAIVVVVGDRRVALTLERDIG